MVGGDQQKDDQGLAKLLLPQVAGPSSAATVVVGWGVTHAAWGLNVTVELLDAAGGRVPRVRLVGQVGVRAWA